MVLIDLFQTATWKDHVQIDDKGFRKKADLRVSLYNLGGLMFTFRVVTCKPRGQPNFRIKINQSKEMCFLREPQMTLSCDWMIDKNDSYPLVLNLPPDWLKNIAWPW